MPIDPQEFAKMLGAEIVGTVPDVGGGPFDMARLAHIMHEHLTPSRDEQTDRPTEPDWVTLSNVPMSEATQLLEILRRWAKERVTLSKVPMSEATLQSLTELAKEMSTDEREISPKEFAAHLLEEAVALLELKRALRVKVATNQFDELFAIGVLGLKREMGGERFIELVDEVYGPYAGSEELKSAYDERYKELVVHWNRVWANPLFAPKVVQRDS